MILNISGSIGYSFRFGFGSDNTHNQNTIKQDPFGIYIGFGFIFIESDSVRVLNSVYLPGPSLELENNQFHGFSTGLKVFNIISYYVVLIHAYISWSGIYI